MRCPSWRIAVSIVAFFVALPFCVAQTATYHLHKEASTINTSFDQLKTAGPDASSTVLTKALANQAAGDYLIKEFETQSGIPNAPGVIPGGSTMSFSLFMRKTASPSGVTVKPEAKLRLNSATGTSLCSVIGSTALTTTVKKITFTCTTPTGSGITMTASDRFYLWVGVNISAKSTSTYSGELDIEGTLNGNFDSTIAVKTPSAELTPTSLSFANQIVNTTSAAQAVVLENNQTSALTISSIATSGDYTQTNNCGTSLAAGASCIINVSFRPTATGTRTGTLTVTDNGNDSPQTASLTGTGIALSSISVTPVNPSAPKGATQQFTATGTYSDGSQQNLTNTATWSSSNPAVAGVNSSGLATGVSQGTSAITATSGSIAGSTTLTVTAPALASIAVTPANPSVPKGSTQQFTATGTYTDNSTQNLTSNVTWTSSATAIATINSGGLASTLTQGASTITATSGSVSGSTTLTVTAPVLASIALTPANPSVPNGSTKQFTATGTYTDNSTQNLTSTATWTSSATAVATISSAGLATAVTQGASTITATSGSVSGSTTLNVTAPALASIAVSPANPSVAKGLTKQFTATGTYTDNSTQDLTTTATWTSSATTIATIDSSGLATTLGQGSSTITATSGSVTGSTTLTVTAPVLSSLAVTPANPSVPKGSTRQFTATATYSDGSTQDLTTTVTWASSTTAVATISSTGLATTLTQGSTTISATSGSIQGSTLLTVSAPALVSIAVTPAAPTILQNATQQFTATGTNTDNSTQDLTSSVVWGSSATTIATIDNSGLATAIAPGTTNITATVGSVSGSATVTVTPPALVSIAVTPSNTSIPAGTPQQFTAMGTYSDGSTQDVSSTATWTSSAPAVVTINGSGVATGLSPGGAVLTAALSGISGSTNVTIGPGAVSYIYDQLGRLTGVVAENGSAAAYHYDAVGNILSITRQGPTDVSIIQFTPQTGSPGTTVTISGTGFSATASQNTVKFATTTATVNSATKNQLTVTVPAGAETGPVTVTTPFGTATSTTAFTVTDAGAVTITGFDPAIALPGTVVHITGSNFNLNSSYDRLRVNLTPQPVNSVSSSVLTTTVAAKTTSGHISVSTPQGRAASLQDFFVPFGNHTVQSVGLTGRINLGDTTTVSLDAGQIGMLLFDAVGGKKINIWKSASALGCLVSLFAPDGTLLAQQDCSNGTSPVPVTLPALDGTYTIGIDSVTSAGSVNLRVDDVSDAIGTITIDGPPVTIATTLARQEARLYFNNTTPGQRLVLYVSNVSNPAAEVILLQPDGNPMPFGGVAINNTPGQVFFLDTKTLSARGTYQLWVQHVGEYVGSETLQLASVPADVSGTLTVPSAGMTGPPATVTTTAAGQNAVLTFSGNAGDILSFNISNSTYGSGGCHITILAPNNNGLGGGDCPASGATGFLDAVTLPATGTYTAFIDPSQTNTGSVTMSINNDADVTGTIAIDGPPVTVSSIAGQDVRLSFTTTAPNQRVVLFASNVSNRVAYVYMMKPDGTEQQAVIISNNPGQVFFLNTQTLAAAGTYQLWVQHQNTYFGGETLQLASVPLDYAATIAIGDPAVSVPDTGSLVAGQNASVTFSGTQGQAITVHISNNTIPALNVVLLDPSNNAIVGYPWGGSSFTLQSSSLPATGMYTLVIDPEGSNTGSMTVAITTP
jgi:YD repeat-containing protein